MGLSRKSARTRQRARVGGGPRARKHHLITHFGTSAAVLACLVLTGPLSEAAGDRWEPLVFCLATGLGALIGAAAAEVLTGAHRSAAEPGVYSTV